MARQLAIVFESHAKATEGIEYDDEGSIPLAWGGKLAFPAFPAECDYLRIVLPDGREAMYWSSDEWHDDPTEVIGAIMGIAQNGPFA